MFANNLASLLPLTALALAFALRGGRESFAFAAVFFVMSAVLFVPRVRSRLTPQAGALVPFALLLAWCAFCVVASPPLARHLYRLSQLTAYALMMVAAATWTERERRRLMLTVVVLGALEATIFLMRRMGDPSATGLLAGNPSYSGLLCAAGFLAALALTRDASNRARLAGALCGLIFAAALIMLRSRSALVGLIAGLWFVLPRKRFFALALALAVGALAAALVDSERTLDYLKVDLSQPQEWLGRLTIWRTAFLGLLQNPVFGWGLGNFESAYLRHQLPINDVLRFDRSSPFAHNDYLQLAVEAGVPALVLFGWGIARFVKAMRGRTQPSDRWSAAVVALFLVAALFNFTVFLPLCGLVAAAAVGFGLSVPDQAATHGRRPWFPAVSFVVVVAFSVFLVLNAVADRLAAAGRPDASVRVMPIRSDLWYAAAMTAMERGDWIGQSAKEAAIFRTLDRAREGNPGDAFVWNRLGVVSMTVLTPPISARDAFDRALTLAPFHAPFWVDAGFERLESGDLSEARQRFERAAALEPNAPIPRFALALTAAKAGDGALARTLVGEAAALHRTFSGAVVSSGYAAYLFGLDEEQMRHRVQRMLNATPR